MLLEQLVNSEVHPSAKFMLLVRYSDVCAPRLLLLSAVVTICQTEIQKITFLLSPSTLMTTLPPCYIINQALCHQLNATIADVEFASAGSWYSCQRTNNSEVTLILMTALFRQFTSCNYLLCTVIFTVSGWMLKMCFKKFDFTNRWKILTLSFQMFLYFPCPVAAWWESFSSFWAWEHCYHGISSWPPLW